MGRVVFFRTRKVHCILCFSTSSITRKVLELVLVVLLGFFLNETIREKILVLGIFDEDLPWRFLLLRNFMINHGRTSTLTLKLGKNHRQSSLLLPIELRSGVRVLLHHEVVLSQIKLWSFMSGVSLGNSLSDLLLICIIEHFLIWCLIVYLSCCLVKVAMVQDAV